MIQLRQATEKDGSKVIELASKTFLGSTDVKAIHAYIKIDNTASIAAFKKTGFSFVDDRLVKNQPAHHLVLTREVVT